MPRLAAVCLVVVLALAAGCTSGPNRPGGEPVVKHCVNGQSEVATVTYRATYALYRESSATGPNTPPTEPNATVFQWTAGNENKVTGERLRLRELRRNDPVGFEWGGDGQLYAIAGKERFPLEDGRYCWLITPETERCGSDRVMQEFRETCADSTFSISLGSPGALLFALMMVFAGGGWG